MTTRLLTLIAGVGLVATFAGVESANAQVPPKATDWACTPSDPRDDMCTDRRIKESLPNEPDEVRHLVYKARFILVEDTMGFVLKLKGGDWLASFSGLPPLSWIGRAGLLPETLCRESAAVKKGVTAEYAHFISEPMPLHMKQPVDPTKEDYKYVEYHPLYIYPIDPATYDDKRAYCLTFHNLEGGSHNGAVHGDP